MSAPTTTLGVYIRATPGARPLVRWTSAGGETQASPDAAVNLLIGDAQDRLPDGLTYLGSAAQVWSGDEESVVVRTSLTGFPPVYCYDGPGGAVIASSIKAIADTPGVQLRLDERGLAEWIHLGKPIGHRTLFAQVSLIPAGVTWQMARDGHVRAVDAWAPPTDRQFSSYDAYLAAQIEAFRQAVRRLDTSRSFISLTAGLDTRAVLAMLVSEGRTIDAVTLSGRGESLDARRARALSRALGLSHVVVHQDEVFLEALESRARDAVRLSGGLTGVDGALEVHMYRLLGDRFARRLSGNLGNQVGRSGTEGIGIRGLGSEWFCPEMQRAVRALPTSHWHQQIADGRSELGPGELIRFESLFASHGNAALGGALALQQTPYGDREVLSNKYAEPALPKTEGASTRGVRFRDILHRVLGEPASRSFQRQIVAATKGPAADQPINWGWRPSGGISVLGALIGAGAAADALVARRKDAGGAVRALARLSGVHGLNGFGSERIWQTRQGRTFIADTLQDAVNQRLAVLDTKAVASALTPGGFAPQFGDTAQALATVVLTTREFSVLDLGGNSERP